MYEKMPEAVSKTHRC